MEIATGKEVGLVAMEGGEQLVRIFVGGLGESVTSGDLSKIFTSLGRIEAVDIIRTKGRSFAYIDFLPSSHNSLSKLFSTYNGCAWRGGRLKLERAKEHYLSRLRREWAEDAQLASSPSTNDAGSDADDKLEFSGKRNKDIPAEMKKLQIFFPKLRKVKSIPFTGTGKHKYSFRRVEVPSLPKYFCDCEEHSDAPCASEEKIGFVDDQGGVMYKEELDMMNLVMSNIFERENVSSSKSDKIEPANEGYNSKMVDNVRLDENEEDSSADDDNLIINVVSGRQENFLANQMERVNKLQPPNTGTTEDSLKRKKENDAPATKRTKYHPHDRNNTSSKSAITDSSGGSLAYLGGPEWLQGDQPLESGSGAKRLTPGLLCYQKSSWGKLFGNGNSSAFNISNILPSTSSNKEKQSDSLDGLNSTDVESDKLLRNENLEGKFNRTNIEEVGEARPSKSDSVSSNLGRGSAWIQKSSWTQLVGGIGSGSFSITQLVPGITFEKQEPVQHAGQHAGDDRTGPTSGHVLDLRKTGKNDKMQNSPEMTLQDAIVGNEGSSPGIEKNILATKIKSIEPVTVGETCSFMRTAASLKEWENAKAALNRSEKRTEKRKNCEK